MITFYQVSSEAYEQAGGQYYYGLKAEALDAARECVKVCGVEATVHKVALRDAKKASIIALANHEGWAAIYEEIAKFEVDV